MPRRFLVRALLAILATSPLSALAQESAPAPLRALLIAGGCCHDYATQKELLKRGLEERLHVQVDVIYSDDTSTKPPIPIYGRPGYAKGYDVVIHDECASDIKDIETVEGVLAPHRAGLPAVNLHCAMHSYRTAPDVKQPVTPGTPESLWFDFIGVQSSGHGKQLPIAIAFAAEPHGVTTGLADWTTINEELYNNIVVREGTRVLATGSQEPNDRPGFTEAAVVWTAEYGEQKARVFSTSLGHNNDTVADERYLDLVARGLLWACGKLEDSGAPAPGYGPKTR